MSFFNTFFTFGLMIFLHIADIIKDMKGYYVLVLLPQLNFAKKAKSDWWSYYKEVFMKNTFVSKIAAFSMAAISAVSFIKPFTGRAADDVLPSGTKYNEIGSVIESFYKENESNAPGLATAVFTPDEVIYEGYFGYQNSKKTAPLNENTVIEWGSVSKTTIWISVMQLAEQGKIDLDADIRTYLPDGFLKKLKYDDKITMINLMNHTAGFEEAVFGMACSKKEQIINVEDYLSRFQPEQIFRPGEVTAYSNWGATLASYIVERISGQEFYEYAQEHIFKPLGMEHTAINSDLSDNSFVDMQRNELSGLLPNGKPNPYPRRYLIMYPAGMCTSTLSDFTAYGQALLSYDERLLSHESYEEMYTPTSYYTGTDLPRNCHGFWSDVTENDTFVIGHGGNTITCSSNLLIDLKNNCGTVIMTNQYGESTFNYGIPEKVFGKIKESNLSYKGFAFNTRMAYTGPAKIIRAIQGWAYIKSAPEQVYVAENSDTIEISVMDYQKTDLAHTAALLLPIMLWELGTLFALISLLVKFIKVLAKKKSKNPVSVWRAVTCVLILVSQLPLLPVISAISSWDLMNISLIRNNLLTVTLFGIALAVLAIVGIIRMTRSDSEKKCKVRNLATSFFACVVTFNVFFYSLFEFWTIK